MKFLRCAIFLYIGKAMADRRIEGIVEKLVPGGDGLVRSNRGVVFVPGVLPGERVLYDVVERRKGWARAVLAEIVEPSSARRTPFCSLFGRCGGCRWQHMDEEAQRDAKASFVREALVRQGGWEETDVPDFFLIPSRPESYRSRIRPIVLPDGSAAFREASTDRPVRVDRCPVAVEGLNRFLERPPEDLSPGDEPVVFGDTESYWAEGIHPEARAEVGGKIFRFPPGVFFQSNLGPLPAMIEFALGGPGNARGGSDAVSDFSPVDRSPSVALDLYGGVGLFGAFLADRYGSVIGVDRDEAAGPAWLRHVGPRGEFHALSLEAWTDSAKRPVPDMVVVDPPRTGLAAPVRRVLAEMRAPRISYVSCDPVTQARDLKDLRAAGYELEAFAVADLYPQTAHVETVARLRYAGKEKAR